MISTPAFQRAFPLFLLIVALTISGCTSLLRPATQPEPPPPPQVSVTEGGIDNPDVYVDPAAFSMALLESIQSHDQEQLRQMMSEPFVTGVWRFGRAEMTAAEALRALYASELSTNPRLALVPDADLPALTGGIDPLSLANAGAGAVEAVLVSGWGPEGADEVVLLIARQPDNRLKWHGWLRINGGISPARFDGLQAYENQTHGFRFYVPQGYIINPTSDYNISIIGPFVEDAGHPGLVSLEIMPADGRTGESEAQRTYAEAKEIMGEWGEVYIQTIDLDGTPGYLVFGVPGQDIHRELFLDMDGMVYRFFFTPEDPHNPTSYQQMLNLYATVLNTFDFTGQ